MFLGVPGPPRGPLALQGRSWGPLRPLLGAFLGLPEALLAALGALLAALGALLAALGALLAALGALLATPGALLGHRKTPPGASWSGIQLGTAPGHGFCEVEMSTQRGEQKNLAIMEREARSE